MAIDKILNKIQIQIKDIAPTLEFFIEETIQPTVDQCDELQTQLSKLQNDIIIYRYLRLNKELSPSFNLHSKISEVQIPAEKPKEVPKEEKAEIKPDIKVQETPPVKEEIKEAIIDSIKSEPQITLKPLAIAINDKFRFINELFSKNGSEYNIALEQINSLRNWHDAEIYIHSLRHLYEWKENNETVKQFYELVKKRFA